MKKEDVIFDRKEFLNLPGHNGMANIVANIVGQDRRYGRKKEDDDLYRHVYCKLDFADCDRRVSMEIEVEDEYSRENALHKVDVLIDVLTEFRVALEKETKYQARLEKKRARKKAEEDTKKKEE